MTKHPFIIHRGDCLEILRDMPNNSVDSVVTDPPYGLSDHKPSDVVACLTAWTAGEEYRPKKKGFMGRAWDSWVPGPEVWREVFRVLKPGGHVVAFAGSRTHDLMSMALRLAGFECRDTVMWVYGSGFPKSMDVSKALDKARNSGRDEVLRVTAWIRARRDELGLKTADLDAAAGTSGMAGHWVSQESQPAIPTLEQWQKLEPLLGNLPEWMQRLLLPSRNPGEAWERREVIGRATDGCGNTDASMHKVDGFAASRSAEYDITAPATDAARQWAGWGTALKPAFEPALLFRKPLDGTVAQNVMRHGTGALNIDGCRIGNEERTYSPKGTSVSAAMIRVPEHRAGKAGDEVTVHGRFPANLIHDGSPEVLAHFPDSNGAGPSLPRVKVTGYGGGIGSGESAYTGGERIPFSAGSGSAARFFYCAKASKRDRNEGCEHIAAKQYSHDGRETPIDNAYQRNSSNSSNSHPTVKPTDLMRYLCRLVTPPGGVVLDPFTGSGSTGKAAMLEGFRFVGCEMSDEYADIAEVRIRHAAELAQAASSKPSDITPTTGDLFEAA